MKRLLILAVCAAALAGSISCIGEEIDPVKNYVNVGDGIPAFTATDADAEGKVNFVQGDFMFKRSVIVLFLSSCGDCEREMPKIHAAWNVLKNEPDFQLVAVSRAEPADKVAAYWSKNGFGDMPYYLDPNKSVFETFANLKVPRIYLVGKDGTVKHMEIEKFGFKDGAELVNLINDKL